MRSALERSELDGLRSAIEAAYPAYLLDLEHLVNIDSGSHQKAGVDVVSEWLMSRLAELGASIVRHPNETHGDTFVATLEGRPQGPTVLMLGHADTVFEAGTAALRPFSAHGSLARGPGVSDMKAGLLTGLYALEALRHCHADSEAWLPVGRLVFVVDPDEEIGSPLSTPLITEQAVLADTALVLEGARPNGDLVSARAGMVHLRITVRGRAAHAGVEPERGRSAILEAAHKVAALHALSGRWDGVRVNVGEIHGGTRPNIVPDSAVLTVDMRARLLVEQEQALAAIEAIVGSNSVPDVSATVEVMARHRPMERTGASGRLVQVAVGLAADLGFDLADCATGGASDANTTAALGVPTLDGLGPVGGDAHSPSEFLRLDSVVPRTTLLAALLVAIGRRHEPRPS